MATIKQWIDESDVYMLILGGRYGSIEPTSGVSYTELEYDYAVEQRKPLFAVVINDAALETRVRAGGTTLLERQNPKLLEQFRSKVLGNISSFFDDAKDIRLCVHESLADMALNRELTGWVSADDVIDTKPLVDEIRKLSDENRQLKEALAERDKRLSRNTQSQESFAELRKVLAAIEVKVPGKLTGDKKEADIDLLTIFYGNKEVFINGVTNQNGIDAFTSFMFFNVCPKLQVHGLTVNEKVAGVRYRRYAITPLGSSFLAEMERTLVLAKAESRKSAPADLGETTPANEPSTDAATKAPVKSAARKSTRAKTQK